MKPTLRYRTIPGAGMFAGVVALLLISAPFSGPAYAIPGGQADVNTVYSNVGCLFVPENSG